MANTVIQLKYSTVTATPSALNVAEPAYSYTSNTLFIGSPSGTGAIAIGGKFYLDQQQDIYNSANAAFAAANAAGTSTTINSAFQAANSAGSYANSAFVHANSAFINSNSAFNHANAAFVVANNESFINITQNNSIAAAFAAANNEAGVNATQNNSIDAAFITANSAGVYANGAFVRANNSINANTGGTITGDLSITGNLSVLGNTFTVSSTTIVANDTVIILGANNYTSDLLDIGFAGHYNDGVNAHAGFIRDHGTKEWQLFEGYTPEIGANNDININDPSFKIATLNANVHSTKILIKGIDLLPYVNIAFNTANAAFDSANNINGVNLTQNNSIAAAFIAANSADAYANSAFLAANIADSKAVSAGSYANSAFIHSNSAFILANGTAVIANTDVTNISVSAGHFGGPAAVTAFKLEANGRISSANTLAISIDASAVTTGILDVVRGGTGAGSFTTNGVLLGQGTSSFTTASSSTEGHLLTINASGMPTFAHLQGGTF
jgi:hypothetical protein